MRPILQQLGDEIPVLETERLILRAPRLEDLDALAAFFASPRAQYVGGPTTRFQSWRSLLTVTGHWVMRGYGYWTMEDRATGQPAGRVGVHFHEGEWPEPELGWHVFNGFEGKGYAYEAALAARRAAATQFGLGPLISLIAPENARSIRLAERLGATVECKGEVFGHPCLMFRHPRETA